MHRSVCSQQGANNIFRNPISDLSEGCRYKTLFWIPKYYIEQFFALLGKHWTIEKTEKVWQFLCFIYFLPEEREGNFTWKIRQYAAKLFYKNVSFKSHTRCNKSRIGKKNGKLQISDPKVYKNKLLARMSPSKLRKWPFVSKVSAKKTFYLRRFGYYRESFTSFYYKNRAENKQTILILTKKNVEDKSPFIKLNFKK